MVQRVTIDMPDEVQRLLVNVAHADGTSLEKVLAKALHLYVVAAQAARDGKMVGLVDPTDHRLLTEFTGF